MTNATDHEHRTCPTGISERRRASVIEVSVRGLLDVVQRTRECEGDWFAAFGQSFPEVSQRRNAVRALRAGSDELPTPIDWAAMGRNVVADLAWLDDSERAYSLDDQPGFDWLPRRIFSDPEQVQALFQSRLIFGRQQAAALAGGGIAWQSFSDGAMLGLLFISDDELRARCMVDGLLQFRATSVPEGEQVGIARRTCVIGSEQSRASDYGPPVIVERRMVLAGLEIDRPDELGRRQYGLARLLIQAHPLSAMNQLFEARDTVCALSDGRDGWVHSAIANGETLSLYRAIHHNFSHATAGLVERSLAEFVFTLGPEDRRGPVFARIVGALELAQSESFSRARAELKRGCEAEDARTLEPLLRRLEGTPDAGLEAAIVEFATHAMGPGKDFDFGDGPAANLKLAARLYRSVCEERPTSIALEGALLFAGPAIGPVADLVARMRDGDELGLLHDLGPARRALREAVIGASDGSIRLQRLELDGLVDRLSLEMLGSTVDRVGDVTTGEQRFMAMIGVKTALECVLASGLDAIRGDLDLDGSPSWPVDALRAQVQSWLNAPRTASEIDLKRYRRLMREVVHTTAAVWQAIRAYVEPRMAVLEAGGVCVDPQFVDQLVKQSPLHYAQALAQKAARSGLPEVLGERCVRNIEGMILLHDVGAVLFPDVIIAPTMSELRALPTGPSTFALVERLVEQEKMVAVGGLLLDTAHAPGGGSHLCLYAINRHLPIVAMPSPMRLRPLLDAAMREGGLYLHAGEDDEHDNHEGLSLMTVRYALEFGLLSAEQVESGELRPGLNRHYEYVAPSDPELPAKGLTSIESHSVSISKFRRSCTVQIYTAVEQIGGLGPSPVADLELAELGLRGRHICGEKGVVLAAMAADPRLGAHVPPSSSLSPTVCDRLLDQAGILDTWQSAWDADPCVGRVDAANFLRSRFYADHEFRRQLCGRLRAVTRRELSRYLLGGGPAGAELYEQLMRNPRLRAWVNKRGSLIARSNFSGEDRPYKNGAGLYDSTPHCRTRDELLAGIIDVIVGAWGSAAIEANVAEEVILRHIRAGVVIQGCVSDAAVSGVFLSRNLDNGARGEVKVAMVPGFGCGVDGRRQEEGIMGARDYCASVTLAGHAAGLLDVETLAQARELVLAIEELFDDRLEPGAGHAVDVEMVHADSYWWIVQARVLALSRSH